MLTKAPPPWTRAHTSEWAGGLKKNPNPAQKIMGIICSALMCKPIIYGKMGKRKSLRRPSQVLWRKINCTQSSDWKRWGWRAARSHSKNNMPWGSQLPPSPCFQCHSWAPLPSSLAPAILSPSCSRPLVLPLCFSLSNESQTGCSTHNSCHKVMAAV